jgi:DNA-binding NarL/FixJ family response regulator
VKASESMLFREHNERYCLTRFAVFEDYEFIGNWGEGEKKGKFISKGEIKTVYNPLEPDYDFLILNHLVNLDWNNLEERLQFFQNFGLLSQITERSSLEDMQRWSMFPHQFNFKEDNAINSALSINEFKRTVYFVKKLQSKKLSEFDVDQILRQSNAEKKTSKSLPDFVEVLEMHDEPQDILSTLKENVAQLIRRNSSFLESTQVYNGKFVYTVSFTSLISVAYFQLRKALLEEKEFRQCLREDCKKLFILQHGHQKFCPPLPGNKKSTCENTHNQRSKRIKQQNKGKLIELRAKGMTFQAISDELQVPNSTLKSWAKAYEREIKACKQK